MNKAKKNILYNLLYQILVLIVPLVTSPYISRTLGPEGLGTYSYVSSIAYYFFILVTLGLSNYGNRSIAKCGDDVQKRSETFCSIYAMQIICGAVVLVAYIIYVLRFAEDEYKLYFLIYNLYIIGAIVDVNWFFWGLQEFQLTTKRNAAVKILTLISVFIFVRNEKALTGYVLIVAGSTFLSNMILWTRLPRYVSFCKPTWKNVIAHFKPNFILFVPILAMSVYRVMDKIMIKELSGVVQNGYYENADRIITISLTAFSAVATVMMPAISNMVAAGDNEKIKRILRDMMQIIMCLSIAMAFGLAVVANRFAPLFFGSQFEETGYLLIGLAPTIILSGWKNVLRSQYLIPYERDRAYVVSLVAGAISNVVCNSIFIPQYGASGAVIGTLCAEFVGFVIQTYVAGKDVDIRQLFKDAVVFVPDGLIMAFIVYICLNSLPSTLVSVFASIVVGTVVYLSFVIISLLIFQRERFAYFLKIIQGRKTRRN